MTYFDEGHNNGNSSITLVSCRHVMQYSHCVVQVATYSLSTKDGWGM